MFKTKLTLCVTAGLLAGLSVAHLASIAVMIAGGWFLMTRWQRRTDQR